MNDPTTVFVEVSNTLSVPYTTGFQRHTRELLARLPGPRNTDGVLRFVPIRWCARHQCYRRLTPDEAERLAHAPDLADFPRTRLSQLGDAVPKPLRGPARALAYTPPARWARLRMSQARQAELPPAYPELEIGPWPKRSIFFDLEAAWHDPRSRAELLPELLEAGVIPATLVADVLPELHPDWFETGAAGLFRAFLRAHMRHSQRFICISRATESDLRALAPTIGITRRLDCAVTTMGADFRLSSEAVKLPEPLADLRYLLCVSTLEPRKNQSMLIDAFDSMQGRYPELGVVLVGKIGWKTAPLVERIRGHPLFGRRLLWFDKVDDSLLDTIYEHAFLAVTPSFSEGFGTPVIEALAHGVPTISSDGGALPEAGGDLAEYFPPTDLDALVRLIEGHLFDSHWHQDRRRALRGYRPPTWDEGAQLLHDSLAELVT